MNLTHRIEPDYVTMSDDNICSDCGRDTLKHICEYCNKRYEEENRKELEMELFFSYGSEFSDYDIEN